ncbi:transposase [Streptomyces sp. col6]|uniref:transposase n=1 Tax=Streptomyces sp. col6 TaxID=2478958 RepID=UPI001746726D
MCACTSSSAAAGWVADISRRGRCAAFTSWPVCDRSCRRHRKGAAELQGIDAIAFTFRTGIQCVRLPEEYGDWRSICRRLRMWGLDGTWERVFTELMAKAGAEEDLTWVMSVDSQSTCGRGPRKGAPADEPADHAIGRSGGGLTTRSHLAADDRRRPLVFVLTAGKAGVAHPPSRTSWPVCAYPTARTTAHPTGRSPRRQGPFLMRRPRAPTQKRHPSGDPRPCGPAGPSAPARPPGTEPGPSSRRGPKPSRARPSCTPTPTSPDRSAMGSLKGGTALAPQANRLRCQGRSDHEAAACGRPFGSREESSR